MIDCVLSLKHLDELARTGGMKIHRTMLSFALPVLFAASLSGAQADTLDPRATQLLNQSRAALGGSAIDSVKVLAEQTTVNQGGLTGTGASWSEIGGTRFAESYSTPPYAGGDGYDGKDAWNRGTDRASWG